MSAYHFNLVDESWLPCMMADGSMQELGLRAVLAQSANIKEIVDASPIVTISLHRLLLAIVHRNVGPKDARVWGALWDSGNGTWDMDVFDAYFKQWHSRFDLFDTDYPFYQWPGLDFSDAVPIAKLTHELAAGNNATLFDHTSEAAGGAMAPASAARYLVAQQAYAVGGLVSYAKHEPKSQFKSADGAPLVRGAATLVKGNTLFATMMLNLHQYDPQHDIPFAAAGPDKPAWEQPTPTNISERRPHGHLDLLTWQSRRIRLCPTEDEHGKLVIGTAVIMKGNQFADDFPRDKAEVQQAFRKLKKPAAGQQPWQPIGFREDRALWRDSLAFMQMQPDEGERPRVLSWLGELADNDLIDWKVTVPIDLFGMSTDKAKVLFWRHERLILPLEYLQKPALRLALAGALEQCEAVGDIVDDCVRRLASLLLAPEADTASGRQPHKDDTRKLAESLAASRVYWSRLEAPFRRFLIQLAADETGEDENLIYGTEALPDWRDRLRQIAHEAFGTVIHGLDGSARSLKASAHAERTFARMLAKALPRQEQRNQKGANAYEPTR